MRVLVAGWFSLADGGATAGDLMVRDVVCGSLRERGIDFDLAQAPAWGPGVDAFRVAPSRYSHLLVACGPVGRDLALHELVRRFAGCRRIAVDVSVLGNAGADFDVVLARDGRGDGRPDLALAHGGAASVPVIARVEVHRQGEYAAARPDVAHSVFDTLVGERPCSVINVDTRLDPALPGRRSPAEVEALLARADVVLTTRLHGLILALRQGVPVVAVDPIPGTAKVFAQARTLGWPAVHAIDGLDLAALRADLEWALTDAARAQARDRAAAGRERAVAALDELGHALQARRPDGQRHQAAARAPRCPGARPGAAPALPVRAVPLTSGA